MITLLPRVTQPRLSEQEITEMPVECFYQLINEVAVFSAECPGRRDPRTGRIITEIPTTDIDDLIADIAVVFHWPPSAYDEMTISELIKWHGLAAARTGQDE